MLSGHILTSFLKRTKTKSNVDFEGVIFLGERKSSSGTKQYPSLWVKLIAFSALSKVWSPTQRPLRTGRKASPLWRVPRGRGVKPSRAASRHPTNSKQLLPQPKGSSHTCPRLPPSSANETTEHYRSVPALPGIEKLGYPSGVHQHTHSEYLEVMGVGSFFTFFFKLSVDL